MYLPMENEKNSYASAYFLLILCLELEFCSDFELVGFVLKNLFL